MAQKTVRAIQLPNGTTILTTLLAQAVPYTDGVGILNERGRMIGWISIDARDDSLRGTQFSLVLEILKELINSPRHAIQPDWSFLKEEGK